MCVYSFQYKINVAKAHMVSGRGIVAQEEGRTLWFYFFYTLRGGPKAGLGRPWLTWALPEVSAMQLPQVGQLR